MTTKKSETMSLSGTAVLTAKPGDTNLKGQVLKRAKYDFTSDDGTITGTLYAVVPHGKTPPESIHFGS